MEGEFEKDIGMVGKGNREAEEWVFRRRMTRRELFISGGKVVGGIAALPILCKLCELLTRFGETAKLTKQLKEARVSWTTLLGEHNAQTLWESIDFHSGNLSPKTQRLTDFESIKGTQLERALFGFRDLMESIKTADGRQRLRNEIKDLERQMDTSGYESFIDNLEKYASSQGGELDDAILGKYFTHVPDPLNPDENYGLGYPEKDWKFMLDVEKAINEKDGKGLSELMKDYKTIESSPQG